MRILVQRVASASVEVEGSLVGSIDRGLLLFMGFGRTDLPEMLPPVVKKILEMRILSDSDGKLNLSLQDIQGQLLLISQFTLYADCTRGRRPDFTQAATPETAAMLYNTTINLFRDTGLEVQTGIFAADMQVKLVNDGPVTFFLEF